MRKESGFTLIELMVSMAIAIIVMAAFFLSYKAQVAAKISQENVLDRTQEARAGLELLASDIRMAGSNPTGDLSPGAVGFLSASPTQLEVTSDFSGGGDAQDSYNEPDGKIDQPGEDVRYTLSGTDLLRQRVGSDTQGIPLVRNVDALNFVYLDANNAPTVNLSNIRSVQISMVVRAGQGHRGLLHAYKDTTAYKNQQGTQILAPPNDTFRRIEFTTTVQCRNMGK